MKRTIEIISLLLLLFACIACVSDKLPEPEVNEECDEEGIKYTEDIKPLIDLYCAFSGCHTEFSDAPGNFSTYEGMESYLNAEQFEFYVIDLKDDGQLGMPPNWPSNAGPHTIPQDELNKIQCWIDLNYPE